MTAEVALLNRHAVALAADSAVTVDGPRGRKVYNTINKLFTLSKYHPVGIMVYSSADIMGVPVETAIKIFRTKHLGEEELETLEEYATRFKNFLQNDYDVFPQAARLKHCVRVVGNQVDAITERLRFLMNEQISIDLSFGDRLRQLRSELIGDIFNLLHDHAEVDGLTDEIKQELSQALEVAVLPGFLEGLAHELVPLNEEELEQLRLLLPDLLLRVDGDDINGQMLRAGETGFVIAGFGSQEVFPFISSFEFVFAFGTAIRMRTGPTFGVGRDVSSAIVPFAQTDMVNTFMEGRSPAFDGVVARAIESYVDGQILHAGNQKGRTAASKAKRIQELQTMKSELITHASKTLAEWTSLEHVQPTLDTLDELPKEDLAVIAEALVNLTIHKRRSSPDDETVGPPTDVAVISKGDGFIWIKRKHYFKPELNPHFIPNYFRGDRQR